MFSNVIIGVDGRSASRDAIALARRLAGPGADFTLAHVNTPAPIANHGHDGTKGDASLAMLALERSETGIDADLESVDAVSVGYGLHQLVTARGGDLLVVGSCHRGAVGQLILGNDTVAALAKAPCSVAVAPAGYAAAPHDLDAIGVGYDGSPGAAVAIAQARGLAAVSGAWVKALNVVSPATAGGSMGFPGAGGAVGDVYQDLEAAARAELATLDGVEGKVVLGAPALELAEFGDRLDLLVVGRHADGVLHALMEGNMVKHLARHPHCPLLIVVGDEREGANDEGEVAVAGR